MGQWLARPVEPVHHLAAVALHGCRLLGSVCCGGFGWGGSGVCPIAWLIDSVKDRLAKGIKKHHAHLKMTQK